MTEMPLTAISRVQLFVLSAAAILLMLPDRLAVWSLACVGLVWLLGVKEHGFVKRFSKAVFVPVSLLGAFVVGLLYTDDLSRGFFEIETRLALLAPLLIGTINGLNREKIHVILRVFACSVVAATLINVGFGLYYSAPELSYLAGSRMTNLIGKHPTYLTLYIFPALLILASQKRASILSSIAILWLLNYSVMAASRSSLLLLVFLSVPMCIYAQTKAHNFKRGILLGIMMISVLFISFQSNSNAKKRTSQLLETNREIVINGDSTTINRDPRTEVWPAALDALLERPIIGHGTGDGRAALLTSYKNRQYQLGIERQYNPHNQFLQTGIQLGVIGIVLTCFFIALPFLYALQRRHYILASVWLMVAALCCVESILERQQGLLCIVVLFGLTFHPAFLSKNASEEQ